MGFWYENCYLEEGMILWWKGRKIWLRKATAGGFFLVREWTKLWLMVGLPFSASGGMGEFLQFKQTTYITRLLTGPEIWHIMLFSQSALIPQLCLLFFQKLKHYTLENKQYSRKLFWVTVAVNVNAKDIESTLIPLVMIRVLINALIWLILDC